MSIFVESAIRKRRGNEWVELIRRPRRPPLALRALPRARRSDSKITSGRVRNVVREIGG